MGTGLIRPAHGFPRRASGWQRRPQGHGAAVSQVGPGWLRWIRSMAFASPSTCWSRPLPKCRGGVRCTSSQRRPRPPTGPRRPGTAPAPGQGPRARQKLEWMAGTGARHQVPAPHGSVSGALQERPAIDAGRPRTSAPRVVSSGPQAQGRGTPGSRTRASRAGNDCDACSLATSKGQEPFGSLQWTPGASAASTVLRALLPPSGAKGLRFRGRCCGT